MELPPPSGRLDVEGVSFQVLRRVSFALAAGGIVFLPMRRNELIMTRTPLTSASSPRYAPPSQVAIASRGVDGSRLSRMIARLLTQRACLEHAARLIEEVEGLVLEVGLGKGRTYDHLRRLLPEREILIFDRDVHAPADCVPADDRLVLGDFRDTLAAVRSRLEGRVALIHADIGSEDRAVDRELAAALGPLVAALTASGGVVLCDRPLCLAGHVPLALPADVEVVQLITAGSPLGMDSVYKRLLVGGPNVPDRVDGWLNAWCAADAVAIGCPLAPRWGRRVVDVATDNPKDRAHDIEEYLADEQVARAVGDRLRRA